MRAGELIAGRYRIERQAGAGGMGTVYEAFDTMAQVRVALKTWRAEPDQWHTPSRLWREARALSEIRHPAVVRYVDHGVSAAHGPFLVMAWVQGETLAARLRSQGVAPSQALRLLERLAAGLLAMHSGAVVHRDLKPSNVMLPGGDVAQATIVDLGVARLADMSGLTTTGGHVGTPRYMAPEQIRSARTVDGRADVFALGCILFECLTGRVAFEGGEPVTVLASILFEPLPIPSAIRGELPRAFDQLVGALLDRDPGRRPSAQTVLELLATTQNTVGVQTLGQLLAVPIGAKLGAELSASQTTSDDDGSSAELLRPSFEVGINAVGTAVERALPPQAGTFVGRELECQHIAGLLRAGTRAVTVWGGPGLGKSRLVIEAVQRAVAQDLGRSWDALVFADLSDARDADDWVRILAREAGVSLATSTAPELALGQALSKLGRVLLVLDAVDHVAAPLSAALRALRKVTSGLQVIATSRSRFCPEGAVAIELAPLATQAEAGQLSPAAQLLLERAAQLLPALESARQGRDPEQAERAERLATALEGVPLAIELYAARVHVLGLEGLLARIPQALDHATPTLDMTQATMRNVIAWSFGLLTEAERSAIAQCAVFRGGFTVDAAESVLSLPELSPSVLTLVQSLRDKSLVHSWAADPTRELRLSMFAPVRELAWEQLASSPELGGTLTRHAAYYAQLPTAAGSMAEPELLGRIEREADNLLAAAEFSLAEGSQSTALGLRALIALEPAVLARGALTSFLGLLDRALDAGGSDVADANASLLASRVRQIRARLDAPRGRSARARADLEHCLEVVQREDDSQLEATVWLDLGVVHHLEHALAEARTCYETALKLLREPSIAVGDLLVEGRCVGNLGALFHDQGDFTAAARSYESAIALLEQAGEARHRANLISNLAVLEQELGRLDSAAELYTRALALLEPMRDSRLLAITLGNLGVLELERQHPERALGMHERSLALLSDTGDRRSLALCLGRLGATLASVGRLGDAEAILMRAGRLARGNDALVEEALALDQAFVELAAARKALAMGMRSEAQRSFGLAKARVAGAVRAPSYGPAARERSDDIRSSLRILDPWIAGLEQVLGSD